MKFIQNIKTIGLLLLPALVLFVTSCKKDATGTPDFKAGNLQVNKIEPDSGSGGTTIYLKGSGLGSIESIVFDNGNVPASFNPVFNNDNVIVFRIPDTANGGNQNVIFTNTDGKSVKVPFRVIALPSVSEVSTVDFAAGSQITITGNNLGDVTKVTLTGTTTEATIVSKEKRQLVIQMPATTLSTTTLDITNVSGKMTTSQTFVNVDAAYGIFKDAINANIENWSWSTNVTSSTQNVLLGANSLKVEYTGSWGGVQLHLKTPLDISPYKTVSFWVKGADDERKISFGLNWANMQTITVPANVWTYYSFDLTGWKNAGVTNFDTWIMQINGDPKTFYMDNLILIK
jgi:hypothetical protein